MYKLGITHVVVDALSRLSDSIEPTNVPNQTKDASLFYTWVEWLNDVTFFFKTRHIEGTFSVQQKQRLVRKTKPFTLKNGELYKMGQDHRL